MKNKLPITEELDFHYLLELMPPLHNVPEYAWLPELFSIVGHESLITLCQYAGGETIKIPTIDELSASVEALQLFYDVDIKKVKQLTDEDVLKYPESIINMYRTIKKVYNAQNS